jgi:hypothetical protein
LLSSSVASAAPSSKRQGTSRGATATGPAALDINGERELRDADPT